jgi:fluoride ion exporter CrcB/FEX
VEAGAIGFSSSIHRGWVAGRAIVDARIGGATRNEDVERQRVVGTPTLAPVKVSIVYLIAAGGYLLVLAPWLVTETGRHPHPRAYLLEFRLASPARVAADAIVNVAAFVPLGWLLARGIAGLTMSTLVRVLVASGFCAGLSLAVETLQFFRTSRFSSLIDVLANTLGAITGAVVAHRWRR